MKIVIATAVYYPLINGVATFSHNLATGLARRGHEVIVLCPSQTKHQYTRVIDGVRTCYLKSTEVKVYPDQIHPVPQKKHFLGRDWSRLFYRHGFKISVFPKRAIKKILDNFHPDVVHVQVSDMIGTSVVSYAKKHHIPVVTTEHNRPDVLIDPLKLPKWIKKPTSALLESYFLHRHGKSDFVTMPTQLAIDELVKGKAFRAPIQPVSNGVDLSHFKVEPPKPEIYTKYHIPEHRPTVLYVGRVDPEKQVGTVINSFREVLNEIPDAILVVVGDGVDRPRLEAMASKLHLEKSVFFLGRVLPPDLYDLYHTGTVFATASEIETQGIVLIEAAACGLPLVAINAGAVAEICRNNENGFLVEKSIPEHNNTKTEAHDVKPKKHNLEPKNLNLKSSEYNAEFTYSIIKILKDEKLRRAFSVNSAKIAATHDLEKVLDQFINIYDQVIKK